VSLFNSKKLKDTRGLKSMDTSTNLSILEEDKNETMLISEDKENVTNFLG